MPVWEGVPEMRYDQEGQIALLQAILRAKIAYEDQAARPAPDPDMLRLYQTDADRARAQLPVALQQDIGRDATTEDVRALMEKVGQGGIFAPGGATWPWEEQVEGVREWAQEEGLDLVKQAYAPNLRVMSGYLLFALGGILGLRLLFGRRS